MNPEFTGTTSNTSTYVAQVAAMAACRRHLLPSRVFFASRAAAAMAGILTLTRENVERHLQTHGQFDPRIRTRQLVRDIWAMGVHPLPPVCFGERHGSAGFSAEGVGAAQAQGLENKEQILS